MKRFYHHINTCQQQQQQAHQHQHTMPNIFANTRAAPPLQEYGFKFTLKRSAGNEVRRFRSPLSLTFREVTSLVRHWWDHHEGTTLLYQYVDDEGDTVTVTSNEEWEECLSIQSTGVEQIIRVTVSKAPKKSKHRTSSSASGDVKISMKRHHKEAATSTGGAAHIVIPRPSAMVSKPHQHQYSATTLKGLQRTAASIESIHHHHQYSSAVIKVKPSKIAKTCHEVVPDKWGPLLESLRRVSPRAGPRCRSLAVVPIISALALPPPATTTFEHTSRRVMAARGAQSKALALTTNSFENTFATYNSCQLRIQDRPSSAADIIALPPPPVVAWDDFLAENDTATGTPTTAVDDDWELEDADEYYMVEDDEEDTEGVVCVPEAPRGPEEPRTPEEDYNNYNYWTCNTYGYYNNEAAAAASASSPAAAADRDPVSTMSFAPQCDDDDAEYAGEEAMLPPLAPADFVCSDRGEIFVVCKEENISPMTASSSAGPSDLATTTSDEATVAGGNSPATSASAGSEPRRVEDSEVLDVDGDFFANTLQSIFPNLSEERVQTMRATSKGILVNAVEYLLK